MGTNLANSYIESIVKELSKRHRSKYEFMECQISDRLDDTIKSYTHDVECDVRNLGNKDCFKVIRRW